MDGKSYIKLRGEGHPYKVSMREGEKRVWIYLRGFWDSTVLSTFGSSDWCTVSKQVICESSVRC